MPSDPKAAAREARLKAALRANLAKRKAKNTPPAHAAEGDQPLVEAEAHPR